MASFNKVIFLGRMTSDPVYKEFSADSGVTKFGLASNRVYTDKDNNKQEEPTFVDFSAFGKLGQLLHQYGEKGKEILVEARLKNDVWEKDGQKQSKLVAIVESFQFVGPPKSDEAQQETPPAQTNKFQNKGRQTQKTPY